MAQNGLFSNPVRFAYACFDLLYPSLSTNDLVIGLVLVACYFSQYQAFLAVQFPSSLSLSLALEPTFRGCQPGA